MRAAVVAEAGRLEVIDAPDPDPAPDEVVLQVDGCGICGTDLHVGSIVAPTGTVLGHEITGTIDLRGSVVGPEWDIGDRVVVRPTVGCGRCDWCAGDRPDHCQAFALIGMERAGGYAERVAVPASVLLRAPLGASAVEQALVEPLAVARHALRRGALAAGETVAVLGAGPIGLAVTAWARSLNAGKIVVTDPSPERRRLAKELGADSAVPPADVDGTSVEPQLVVECTGAAGVIDQAMQIATVRGRVVVAGVCPTRDDFFPWWGLQKELDLGFAIYYGHEDFAETVAALNDHTLDVDGLVTGTVSLENLPDRFAELAVSGTGGKVVVVPR